MTKHLFLAAAWLALAIGIVIGHLTVMLHLLIDAMLLHWPWQNEVMGLAATVVLFVGVYCGTREFLFHIKKLLSC